MCLFLAWDFRILTWQSKEKVSPLQSKLGFYEWEGRKVFSEVTMPRLHKFFQKSLRTTTLNGCLLICWEVKIFSWVSGRHEWEMAGQVSNLDIRDDTDQAANLPFYLLQGDSKDFRNILLPVCGGTPFPDFSSATVTVCFFAPLLCQPELSISATRFFRTNTKNSLMSSHNPLCSKTRDVTETMCALYLDAGQKK